MRFRTRLRSVTWLSFKVRSAYLARLAHTFGFPHPRAQIGASSERFEIAPQTRAGVYAAVSPAHHRQLYLYKLIKKIVNRRRAAEGRTVSIRIWLDWSWADSLLQTAVVTSLWYNPSLTFKLIHISTWVRILTFGSSNACLFRLKSSST